MSSTLDTSYASLVDAMRRRKIRTKGNDWPAMTSDEMTALAMPFYDFGGMFVIGHPEEMSDEVKDDYEREIMNEATIHDAIANMPKIAIGMLWPINVHRRRRIFPVVVVEAAEHLLLVGQNQLKTVRSYAHINGDWVLFEMPDAQAVVAIACLMARDAELNVEFVERPESSRDSVNRGRAKVGLNPIPATRVISLSKIRKQYLGGSNQPHQGGTHRSPRGHVRKLTARWINPVNRKPYYQEEREVPVKGGPATVVTKVVL